MLRRVGLLVVLLLLMVVTTGAIHAAPRMSGPKPTSESGGVLDRIWGWLSILLHPAESAGNHARAIWDAEGSHWDPNGNH
jgi:hypothetical protein